MTFLIQYASISNNKVIDSFLRLDQSLLYSNPLNRSEDTYVETFIAYCDPTKDVTCLSHDDQALIFNSNSDWRLSLFT